MYIQNDNEKLLKKLTEISYGKQVSFYKGNQHCVTDRSNNLKTLNYWYKKKECKRIEGDNVTIAKRLIEKESQFSRKSMEADYQMHLIYKSQLLKIKSNKYFQFHLQGNEITTSISF